MQGELGICNYAAERIASAAAKGLKQFTIIPVHLPQPPDYRGAAKVAADATVTSVLEGVLILSLQDFNISRLDVCLGSCLGLSLSFGFGYGFLSLRFSLGFGHGFGIDLPRSWSC